jgi:hypothetical protein
VSNRAEVVKRRVDEAGPLYRITMAKAYAGDCSPRAAIKAQCLICVGYERDSITNCTGWSCPLFAFRPYQKGEA